MICGYDNFTGKEVFELSRDIDDMRRLLMICGLDSFAAEKVFDKFPDFDDLRLRQDSKRKSL